jgi:hypothetical protein
VFDVFISGDGNRIAMTATPDQFGTPEGFARVMDWDAPKKRWMRTGDDTRLSDVDTLWFGGEEQETLQYTQHVELSGNGDRVLVVAHIPFTYYLQVFELLLEQPNGGSFAAWNRINNDNHVNLALSISDAEHVNANFHLTGTYSL